MQQNKKKKKRERERSKDSWLRLRQGPEQEHALNRRPSKRKFSTCFELSKTTIGCLFGRPSVCAPTSTPFVQSRWSGTPESVISKYSIPVGCPGIVPVLFVPNQSDFHIFAVTFTR